MTESNGVPPDIFAGLLTDLADGQSWKLIRAEGWSDFLVRLSECIGELSILRRQAIVMLLFAFAEGTLSPEQVSEYLASRQVDDEAGLAEFVEWLRQFRPVAD